MTSITTHVCTEHREKLFWQNLFTHTQKPQIPLLKIQLPSTQQITTENFHRSPTGLPVADGALTRNFSSIIRNTVWEKYTPAWQRLLHRFLGLAVRDDRGPLLLGAQLALKWKHTTTACYWIAVLCVRKVLSLPRTTADTRLTRVLEHNAKSEIHDYPWSMHHTQVLELWSTAVLTLAHELVVVLICLSFLLGQRQADMAQLAVEDVTLETNDLYNVTTVVITVRRGKVIPHIGPYTLHVSGHLAHRLWRWREHRRTTGNLFLFSKANTDSQREHLNGRIRNELKGLDQRLELRSIRRGGLEMFALCGMPMELIRRNFSKHTTEAMLVGYLRHGAASWDQTQQQLQALRWFNEQPLSTPDIAHHL